MTNSDSFAGSLTAPLISRHRYQYFCQVLTYAYPDADSGATASGEVALTIFRPSSATTVTPEPTSLALAGCAGFGLAAGAWRRRRTQTSQAA